MLRENDPRAGRPGPRRARSSPAPPTWGGRAWNPTLRVVTAGQSSAAEPSSHRPVYAASVAKQFTAFLAALLITERRWTAADQIRATVPELPSWADGIEVQHLVHHSSGLPSTPRLRQNGVEWPVAWGNAEVLAAIVRDIVPVRPPGVGWEYCNLGYVLLAVAIERLVGRPFGALARERLFEPAGITASQFGRPPLRARVTGTEPATIGEGGLWTTPADLERWNQAMNARAFGTITHDLAERPGRLQDGSIMANGWGVGIVRAPGRVLFHRDGSSPGRDRNTDSAITDPCPAQTSFRIGHA